MQQVFFRIPIFQSWFPDGLPIHGFGVMLFITFILGVWFLVKRSKATGVSLPRDKAQDMVIVLFVAGLAGARLTYMIQFNVPLKQFLRIWEGGIVLYGGIIAGILAYLLYFRVILRKAGVSFWKLADVVAPGLALCIALGRIGCLMNGCCYGHVVGDSCPAIGFPVLTAPARDIVVDSQALQTPTGFTVKSTDAEPRSVVTGVEVDSSADRAGLRPGDVIIGVNGSPNGGVLIVWVRNRERAEEQLAAVAKTARDEGAEATESTGDQVGRVRVFTPDAEIYKKLRTRFRMDLNLSVVETDVFADLINTWRRGDHSFQLGVWRNGNPQEIGPITPRTIGLHPTQIYETISMLLLMAFLIAFHPFRAFDGQGFALFAMGYAIHRFLNEILRNDTPVEGFQMTLSQNISVLMFLFGIALMVGRWWAVRRTRSESAV